MWTALALGIALLSLSLSAVTALALVEMLEQLRHLRQVVGVRADAIPLTSNSTGEHLARFGVPGVPAVGKGTALLLSPRCSTCTVIASNLGRAMPAGLLVVVTGSSKEEVASWLDATGLPQGRVTIDDGSAIAEALGVRETPVAVTTEAGRIVGMFGLPSYVALERLLVGDPPSAHREPVPGP